MTNFATLAAQGLQIVWINALLSGDNAVVIALACRGLAAGQRRWAVGAGSGAAVALRILLTIFVVTLLRLPYLKLVGGLVLLGIAVKLLLDEGREKVIAVSPTIWGAIRTIAVADAVMSLDNVVAIAAAARNNVPLIVFGIAVSVPFVVFGSTLILGLLTRFPILVVAGAALLGWVAGSMIAADPSVVVWLGTAPESIEPWISAAGAAVILCVALLLRWRRGGGDGPASPHVVDLPSRS